MLYNAVLTKSMESKKGWTKEFNVENVGIVKGQKNMAARKVENSLMAEANECQVSVLRLFAMEDR